MKVEKENKKNRENNKETTIENKEVKKEIVENNTFVNKQEKSPKIYFGYYTRVVFNILIIIVLTFSMGWLIPKTFNFQNNEINKYIETSNIDYKILMHPNDFYETTYLNKDMIYIANLIDKVSVDFDYNFVTDKNENVDFVYNIIGNLDITNSAGTKSFYTKKYVLSENKKIVMKDTNKINIKENLEIDYGYYNEIANKFKNTYGIETESKLDVYLVISKIPKENSEKIMNGISKMNITIPLTQRAVEIQLDYSEINKVDSIIKTKKVTIDNTLYFIMLIGTIILIIISTIKFIKKISLLQTKKNNYDKFIEKILREYDRLIVETSTLISFKKKEIIKVNKFSELLDIHDNLQLPIMYYSINKHQKCYLYVYRGSVIYLMVVKAVDLEDPTNEITKI